MSHRRGKKGSSNPHIPRKSLVPKVAVGRARGASRRGRVVERLMALEAQHVLRRLLAAHPVLRAEAERIARSQLRKVNFETIAKEVELTLSALDLDDLNGHAEDGSGYLEPTEAAWEALEDTLEPFVWDMKRRIDLGLKPDALKICKGVVLGLYRLEQGEGGELLEWAPDFPKQAAADIVGIWRRGVAGRKTSAADARRKRPAFPQEFTKRHVPEWRAVIAPISSRKQGNT